MMDAAVAIIHLIEQPSAGSWQIIQDFIVHEHLDCGEDQNSYTFYVCGDESHVEKLVNCLLQLEVKFVLFRKVEAVAVVSSKHPPEK
jgi:hypothetical protein